MPIPENVTVDQLLEKLSQRISQAVYRVHVPLPLTEGGPVIAEDLSGLTVNGMLDKIEDFLGSDPIDEHYSIFLRYLARYPVSMCSRQVSPVLKMLIGFHYQLGKMVKEEHSKVKVVSMEELAEIFGRSKATIHECVKATEESWKEFLEFKKREEEVEAKAERELIEEAKERLRKKKPVFGEKNVQNEETNERTLTSLGREDNTPQDN